MQRRRSTENSRRDFFKLMGLGGLFFTARGAFAEELTLTPSQTIGPYYPNVMPLDRDNDLLVISDAITPAVGDITWVSGRVLDRRGDPIRGALVEIWQADVNGAYIHTGSTIRNRDAGFQGYGKFVTGSTGEYVFRTIKPGIYPGRTRHIHYAVTIPGQQRFTTQLYEAGLALNNNDGVLSGVRDAAQRASVVVPWTGIEGSRIGEVSAKFDIVMGYTLPDKIVADSPKIFSLAGIANAASFIPATAAGSRLRIFGYGFAAGDARELQSEDVIDGRLPESLNGVSVKIDGQAAAVLSVSADEVQVLMPNEVSSTAAEVVVENPNGTSEAASIEVRNRMPALYLESLGHVTASREDGTRIGPPQLITDVETQPARSGDVVSIFATGLGRTDPEVPSMSAVFTDPVPNVADSVTVRLHNQAIQPQSARLVKPAITRFSLWCRNSTTATTRSRSKSQASALKNPDACTCAIRSGRCIRGYTTSVPPYMIVTLIAMTLFAQGSSAEMDRAKEEIRRLETLVAAGAIAPAKLIDAKQGLADAEDAAALDRTLYAHIELQNFTEAQVAEMVGAAERRVRRQSERIDKQQRLVAAGVLAPADAEPLKLELESRKTVVALAHSRSRLLQELAEMARSEEAVLTPSTVLGRGGPLIEHFSGAGRFNDGDLKRIVLEFEKEFAKPLPISAKGETAVHKAMGFDHRGRVDVGVSPDSDEGRWMRKFLSTNKIPYIAFRRSIAGQATAAHIHIGTPSPKLAPSAD